MAQPGAEGQKLLELGPLIDPARGLPRKQPLRGAEPALGDRILLYRDVATLQRVLQKDKTMEVRHIACSPGSTWLAAGGEIFGWGVVGESFVPRCLEEFRDYEGEHRVVAEALPYQQTHLWPITDAERLAQPVPFRRLRGPTTWVGFCPVDNKVQDAPRRSGLTNVGQSCFINAALQGLYSSRLWRHMLTEVGNEVARDLWHVWRGMMAAAVTRPEPILERWYHGVQEDSFQFLRGVAEDAGLTALTHGLEQFYLRCADCKAAFPHGPATAMSEMQMHLPTDAQDLQGVVDNYFSSMPAPENVKYCDREWQCPHCKSMALPARELRIEEAPRVLLAVVKRWHTEFLHGQFVQHKDRRPIGVPKMLDVQGNRYAAVAAVHHIGASVDEGHYYAAVRGEDDSWLIVNDSVITAMEAEKFLNVQDAGAMEGELYYVVLEKASGGGSPQPASTEQDAEEPSEAVEGGAAALLQPASTDQEAAGPLEMMAEGAALPVPPPQPATTEHSGMEPSEEIEREGAPTGVSSPSHPPPSFMTSSPGPSRYAPAGESTGAPAGVRGAAAVDGVLPPPASPMRTLSHGQDSGSEDAESLFEADVAAFLTAASTGSIAEALRDMPAQSPFVDKFTFEQCLCRLQAGLKAVREGTLTAGEEVDVFTPLWWLADYRLAIYMEAFARVVALSSTMLLETFKAFASSLLHRNLAVQWSDYTLSHRYWAQVVTDIGTGKSPVMKTVREAFKRAVASWLLSSEGVCVRTRVIVGHLSVMSKAEERVSQWLAGPAEMEHHLITESTHAAFNARLQQGDGHGLLVGPEGSAFLCPEYAKSGKFTKDSHIVLTRLLEAAHGGRYDWDTQADVLARPVKARKTAGHEERVDCGVHFETTNIGMVLLQQPSVLSTWWAPSEARHKIGLANRDSAGASALSLLCRGRSFYMSSSAVQPDNTTRLCIFRRTTWQSANLSGGATRQVR